MAWEFDAPPDGAEELVMEYSTQNYGTGRARTSLSLTGGA